MVLCQIPYRKALVSCLKGFLTSKIAATAQVSKRPVSTVRCHAAICPESGADRAHRLDHESIAIDPTLASPGNSSIGISWSPGRLDHSGLMFANLITFAH